MKEGEKVGSAGVLYLVATPIGNLKDISQRALDTLRTVDFIAAEDTRHSRVLLTHHGIAKPLMALHEHNETGAADKVLDRVDEGQSAALVSDAGTPLISDPGFIIVQAAIARGIKVSPIPGPCALIAALSSSGLPTDRFQFLGFPPRSAQARRTLLESNNDSRLTTIFYESSHRILDFCIDITAAVPGNRAVTIARELTKLHESVLTTTVAELASLMQTTPYSEKGEFVVLIAGAKTDATENELSAEQQRVLTLLMAECTVKTSVSLASRITGAKRDLLYAAALKVKGL